MINTNVTKIALAIAAFAVTSQASAQAYEEEETVFFEYSQAELQEVDGAAQLKERIRKFARRACQSANPLTAPKLRRECRKDVMAQLEEQIPGV